jgi:hypothetical protein
VVRPHAKMQDDHVSGVRKGQAVKGCRPTHTRFLHHESAKVGIVGGGSVPSKARQRGTSRVPFDTVTRQTHGLGLLQAAIFKWDRVRRALKCLKYLNSAQGKTNE